MSKDGFTAVEEYAASKKYTDDTVDGMGIQRGKNCIMLPVERVSNGTKITFQWENDGTQQEQVFIVPDGAQGPQGATGIQGIQGPAGQDGEDGKDFGFEQIVYTVAELKALVATTSPPEMLGLWLQSDNQHIYAYIRDDSFVPVTEGITEGYEGLKFFKDLGEINLITIKGKDGRDGAQGPQGVPGQPGAPGAPGASPTVEVVTSLGGHEAHLEIENVGGATTITDDFMPNKIFTGTAISTTQIGTSGIYRDVVIAIADSKVNDYYRNKDNHQVFLRTDKNGVVNTWEYQYNAKGITGYEEYKQNINPSATYEEYAQYMRGQALNPKRVWSKPNLNDSTTDLYRIYYYKIDSTQGAGDAWCYEGTFSSDNDVAIGKYSIFDGNYYLTFTTDAIIPSHTSEATNEYVLIYNEQTLKAQAYAIPLDASAPTTVGSEMDITKTKEKPSDSTLYEMTLMGMGTWVTTWWEGTDKDSAYEITQESTSAQSDVSSIKTDAIGTTMVITRESGIETEVDMYSDKVMPKIRADRAKRDVIKDDELLRNRWFEVYDTTDNISLIHRGDNNSYMEYRGGKIDTTVTMPPFDTYKYQIEDSCLLDASDTLIDTISWSQHEFVQDVSLSTSLTVDEGYYMTHSLRGASGTTTVEYLPGFEVDFSTTFEKQVAFNLMQDGKAVATYDIGFNGVTMDLTHERIPYDSWKGAPYYFGTKNVYQWDATKDMWVIVLDNWLYSASADATPLWMGGYSIGMYLNSTTNKYELKITQDASSAEAYRTLVDSEGVLDPSGNEIVLTGGQSLTLCNNIADATTMTYSIHEKYTGRTLTCVAVRYGSKFFILSTSENVDYTAHHTVTTQERCTMLPYITMSGTMTFYDKTLSKTILWDGSACIEFLQGEIDTFPAHPTYNQEYTSNSTKAKYVWDGGNKYWELKDGLLMQLFNASHPIGKIEFGAMPELGTWSPYDFGGVIYSDNALSDGQVMQARLPNATGVVSIGSTFDAADRAYRIIAGKGAFYKGTSAERLVPYTVQRVMPSGYTSDSAVDSAIKFDASASQYYDTATSAWKNVAGRDAYTNEEITNGYSVAVKGKNVRAWIRTA